MRETFLLSSFLHFGGDWYEIFDRESSVFGSKISGLSVDVYGLHVTWKQTNQNQRTWLLEVLTGQTTENSLVFWQLKYIIFLLCLKFEPLVTLKPSFFFLIGWLTLAGMWCKQDCCEEQNVVTNPTNECFDCFDCFDCYYKLIFVIFTRITCWTCPRKSLAKRLAVLGSKKVRKSPISKPRMTFDQHSLHSG
jgi:hypothetical protein